MPGGKVGLGSCRSSRNVTRRSALGTVLGGVSLLAGCATGGSTPHELTLVGAYPKRLIRVKGYEMAFVEAGQGQHGGASIVFLHGNPTSSYIWRNIIPYAEPYGRCIAPDLMGMGDSAKLKNSGPDSYSFEQQAEFLDAFLSKLKVKENVIFVGQDWGAALAFDWARRHPDAVLGIAYTEAYFLPLSVRLAERKRPPVLEIFNQADGMRFVLYDGYLDQVLFGPLRGHLKSRDEIAYRKPFAAPGEDRRVLLAWAQQVPFAGAPANTWNAVASYSDWLPRTKFNKLLLRAERGSILRGDSLEFAAGLTNQRQEVIPAGHYIQEETPDLVGEKLASWLARDLGLIAREAPKEDREEPPQAYLDEVDTQDRQPPGRFQHLASGLWSRD